MTPAPTTLRRRLRDELAVAMKSGDRVAMSALRSALAAIDNAEAAETTSSARHHLAIEQIPRGVGATEVERRVLTDSDVERIVRAEMAEWKAAARHYDQAGQPERAEQLRREVSVLSACLSTA